MIAGRKDRVLSTPFLIVLVLSAAYVAFFSYYSFMRYENFLYYDFDLAIGNQICWNLLNGSLDCSIRGGPFLGDHFRPIFFFFIPLYALFPSPCLLLFFQSLALGCAAIPVYLIGKRLINEWWGALFAFLYLIYPATGYVNSFEFHPVALTTFFLLMAIYGWIRERFWLYFFFALLSLLCREDIGLVLFCVGLYGLIIRRKWPWSLVSIAVGGIWFYLCVKVFIPHFRSGPFEYSVLFSHFGDTITEAILNILKHPVGVIRILLMPPKPLTLLQLFLPVFFLPILSPLALLPTLPIILGNFLSSYRTAWSIRYQYTAAVIPFIFLSAIIAMRKLLLKFSHRGFRISTALTLVIVAVISNYVIGPLPGIVQEIVLRPEHQKQQAAVFRTIIEPLKEKEGIVSTFRFLPVLSSRRSLYSFHEVMMGSKKLSPGPFLLPADVEWAVVDFADPITFSVFYWPALSERLQKFVSGAEWGIVDVIGSVAILKKGEVPRYNLIRPMRIRKPANVINARSADLAYLGYELSADTWNGIPLVSLTCYWESIQAPQKDYAIIVELVDENGSIVGGTLMDLGYHIVPTSLWKRGQKIETLYRILALSPPQDGPVFVRLGLVDKRVGSMVPFTLPGGLQSLWLPAGRLIL